MKSIHRTHEGSRSLTSTVLLSTPLVEFSWRHRKTQSLMSHENKKYSAFDNEPVTLDHESFHLTHNRFWKSTDCVILPRIHVYNMCPHRCPEMYSGDRILMAYIITAILIATSIIQTTSLNYYRDPFSFSVREKQLNIESSPAGWSSSCHRGKSVISTQACANLEEREREIQHSF